MDKGNHDQSNTAYAQKACAAKGFFELIPDVVTAKTSSLAESRSKSTEVAKTAGTEQKQQAMKRLVKEVAWTKSTGAMRRSSMSK